MLVKSTSPARLRLHLLHLITFKQSTLKPHFQFHLFATIYHHLLQNGQLERYAPPDSPVDLCCLYWKLMFLGERNQIVTKVCAWQRIVVLYGTALLLPVMVV